MTKTEADRALVEDFLRNRREDQFRLLYRAHTPRMLALARRSVADSAADPEDVVQEAWVRAVAALPRFEWRSSLATWLGGMVINVAREQRRRVRPSGKEERAPVAALTDPLAAIEVDGALSSLAPGYRTIVVLHDRDGHTHEEIAAMTGIQPGTSKSQLARARARLRALLLPRAEDR